MALSIYDIKRILRPNKDNNLSDDFRVIDVWPEYKKNSDVNKRMLNFLCYELETINPETGEKYHFYKALKFLRVIRLPKDAKQSTSFMDKHEQVLTAVWEHGINLVTVIANIKEPVPIGLLFLYGVQGVALSLDDAKAQAQDAYAGFEAAMRGTYRVLEMRNINAQETEWLREKMYNMDYMTVIRGIPKANRSGEDAGNKGMGGKNLNPDSQGTLENIIAGMTDYEYVIQVLSTPVYRSTLRDWSRKLQKDMTDWNGQLQGTKSFSFNLSLPMMFGANQNNSQGWNKAYTDANSVNYSHGESFNTSVGENVAQSLSQSFGQSFGTSHGQTITDTISQSHGISQGQSVGESVGHTSGVSNSSSVSSGSSYTHSEGISSSQSFGTSLGTSMNHSYSLGNSTNHSASLGDSTNHSSSFGSSLNHSDSSGTSLNHSDSMGSSLNHSDSVGSSTNHSDSLGSSLSHSDSVGTSESHSNSTGSSTSHSDGTSFNNTTGQSSGSSHNLSMGENSSTSQNYGASHNVGNNQSVSQSNSTTLGQSAGTTQSQTTGHTTGLSEGDSYSSSLSHGTSSSGSHSTGLSGSSSYGGSTNHSDTQSESVSINHSDTSSNSTGASVSSNHSESNSNSTGLTLGSSVSNSDNHSTNKGGLVNGGYGISPFGVDIGSQSFSDSTGHSQTGSASVNTGASSGVTNGYGASVSSSQSQGQSNGYSMGATAGSSDGYGSNWSQGNGWSNSDSVGWGTSDSAGSSTGHSASISDSTSTSNGFSASNSTSLSNGVSQGNTYGMSESSGTSESYGISNGQSLSEGWGANSSVSNSQSIGQSSSDGYGSSITLSDGYGASASHSNGYGSSMSSSDGYGSSTSSSNGYGSSLSSSDGYGSSMSSSDGYGSSQSISDGYGSSSSVSDGYGSSESMSDGYGSSSGSSQSYGTGTSSTDSYGTSYSVSSSTGYSESVSKTESVSSSMSESYSESQGQSVGQSTSESTSNSVSNGVTDSHGTSKSVGQGNSYSEGTGRSQSISTGMSGAYATGVSSSMGINGGIGYNKSYQWLDQQVKDILELLEFKNERVKKALRGSGMMYTYVYVACPSQDALSAAMTVAKATWQNAYAMTEPLQVLELTDEEQHHLLYHFAAFSTDVTRERVYGVEEYKYATALLPGEFTAYTHLPRISEGGIFTEVNDVPKFSVPSMKKGEIYMGKILSAERFSALDGYETPFDYRLDESELMHGFFTGASRSGKTVAAMRFVAELSRVRRKKTGKRMRIVCMDPKQDWRTLARYVEPERFNFYSLGKTDFHPIHLNPLKIPKGVEPQFWIDGLIDIYCRAYGLLERGKQMMGETIYALYEEEGVFEARKNLPDGEWQQAVTDLSSKVTFRNVYRHMEKIKASLEDPTNPKGRAGNDTRDAYARLLDRLQAFNRDFAIEYKLFGTEEGIGVDELIGEDDVTVLESKGLEKTFRNFIFGIITSGFYKFAIAHEGGFLAKDQFETLLVIEEANEVLTGNDAAGSGGGAATGLTVSGQSEFEEILDQSAGYGLFIIAITQRISLMPASIIANAGLVFSGKLKIPDDVNTVIRAIAREERYEDRDLVKWLPRSPIGWFVCQSSRCFDFKDMEPCLVHISQLNIQPPTNAEIDAILVGKRVDKINAG